MRVIRSIGLLGLVIGLYADQTPYSFEQLKGRKNVVSLVVIGSGPAGCTAAIQASRLGLDVVMCDGPQPGGQLVETGEVENWPGIVRARGAEIMDAQRKQVENHGVTIIAETVKTLDCAAWPYRIQTEEGTQLSALSILVATGSAPRRLGVPGEQQFWGMGVSACALCDGRFFKDKTVAVIGGGDSAIEELLQLTPYANNLHLCVRSSAMRASQVMQDKLADVEHLTIHYNKAVQDIVGDENGVSGLLLRDAQTNQTEKLAVDGVFLAIGHEPRTALVQNIVELTPQGYIKTIGQSQATSMPGLFAAGDVTKGMYRQAGVAAGEGQKAAEDACLFLQHIGLTPPVIKALRSGKRAIEGLQFYSK